MLTDERFLILHTKELAFILQSMVKTEVDAHFIDKSGEGHVGVILVSDRIGEPRSVDPDYRPIGDVAKLTEIVYEATEGLCEAHAIEAGQEDEDLWYVDLEDTSDNIWTVYVEETKAGYLLTVKWGQHI